MKPQKQSTLDMAFPTSVKHLMPPMEAIPQEFHNGRTFWNDLFSKLFYEGGTLSPLTPKAGIDKQEAITHLRAVMGSWEPKHEHKDAAVAFLFSEWFVLPDKTTQQSLLKSAK